MQNEKIALLFHYFSSALEKATVQLVSLPSLHVYLPLIQVNAIHFPLLVRTQWRLIEKGDSYELFIPLPPLYTKMLLKLVYIVLGNRTMSRPSGEV